MKNTLKIKNFLIFSDIELEVKRFTVLIGPQASGKSIAAKLLYLFYGFPVEVNTAVHKGEMKRAICNIMRQKFTEIFPKYAWERKDFQIIFETEKGSLSFAYEAGKALSFNMTEYYDNMLRRFFAKHKKMDSIEKNNSSITYSLELNQYMEAADWGMIVKADNNMFIPAGRSFFAGFDQNVFTFLYSNIHLEYFLKEFGMYYERCRNRLSGDGKVSLDFNAVCKQFLHGIYLRVNQKDYIISDAKKSPYLTEIRNSSSGQQELLPILLTIQSTNSAYLTIEEPEAHIYPKSQYDIIRYLVSKQKWSNNAALLITTHSPYVLTALNNLAYAGALSAKLLSQVKKDEWKKLCAIYPPDEHIQRNEMAAYIVKDGTLKNIVEPETGLINAEDIDEISDKISDKFSAMIDLEIGER